MFKHHANKVQAPQENSPHARKSSRLASLSKNDYYLMGSGKNLDIYGIPQQQEAYTRKRLRKNYRYDDSEDFEFARRQPTKKMHLFNKIQALLKKKDDVRSFPIQSPDQSRIHKVKAVANQNLSKFGTDLQAIFINIDWDKKGQTLQDFKTLKIDTASFMRKGMLFVWAPKQKLSEIIYILEQKQFSYVENFEIINFDRDLALNLVKKPFDSETNSIQNCKKTKSSKKSLTVETLSDDELIHKLSQVQPTKLITEKKKDCVPYFNESKKTLLLFRKESNEKIELRHQRTCDVVFDMPSDPKQKCKGYIREYVFKMIETLLPKGIQEEKIAKGVLKMMELWGYPNEQRRGWIHINQK